jgi:hypothetical protein
LEQLDFPKLRRQVSSAIERGADTVLIAVVASWLLRRIASRRLLSHKSPSLCAFLRVVRWVSRMITWPSRSARYLCAAYC